MAGAIQGFKRRLTATDVMCLSNYLLDICVYSSAADAVAPAQEGYSLQWAVATVETHNHSY